MDVRISPTPASAGQPNSASLATPGDEIVAAIVAAITHLRRQDPRAGGLGSGLQAGRGDWWQAGVAARTGGGATRRDVDGLTTHCSREGRGESL